MARATERQLDELKHRTRRTSEDDPRFISREMLQAFLNGQLVPEPMGLVAKSNDPNDQRVIQAKRYFDLGVGEELRLASFEKYLATIPVIPPQVRLPDREFPLLVLVEERLPLKMHCALANVDFDGDDSTFRPLYPPPLDPRYFPWPYWIRMQDGRKNRNRSVDDCRSNFTRNELGLTAIEGISAYIQHPEIVTDLAQDDGYAMSLPGSVRSADHRSVAFLRVDFGRVSLVKLPADHAAPRFGAASRRKI